jgi:tight adherence protein B
MFPAAVVTFVVSLAIVLGAYWAFVMRPEAQTVRRLKKRLRAEQPDTPGGGEGLTKRPPPLSALRSLDTVLGRSGRLIDPLRRMVDDSALSVTVGVIVLASVLAALTMYVFTVMATGLGWLSALLGVAAGSVPYVIVRYVATKRLRQFEDQFPQAIDLMASSLRAGHALTTGISIVGDEVADPMGAEFRLLYDHQNYGLPLPDALKAFARRVPLLDARFFVTAVMTQREAGGNLAEVLDNLSSLIRERSRVKRQVRVASAHGRITGYILTAMPPAIGIVLTVIAPDHMRDFILDPLGVRMVVGAIVLQLIGMIAIRRIVNVEF